MTSEKWKQILGNILDNFEVEEHEEEHIDEMGGIDLEYVIFKSPLGRVKLEYEEKPVVLDKKTTYSHRAGSETSVEYVYSETEKSQRMKAYKWDEAGDEWEEMNAGGFS
ncbi:hypothetical protein GF382_01590 [Candidatus Falkowbacteria bacterium]|nr:hypothetical protein [Candidatus Falkowbacteria bacterium]